MGTASTTNTNGLIPGQTRSRERPHLIEHDRRIIEQAREHAAITEDGKARFLLDYLTLLAERLGGEG